MKQKKNLISLFCTGFLCTCTLFSGCSSSSNAKQDETEQASENEKETNTNTPVVLCSIDYGQKEDDVLILNLNVYVFSATFRPDFDADMIRFGNDLADAKDIQINKISDERSKAEISLRLDSSDLDLESLDLNASLSFASGALQDEEGTDVPDFVLEQELIYMPEDKGSDGVDVTYLPASKTLIYRFEGDHIPASLTKYYFDTIMENTAVTHDSHQVVSYLIFDFTKLKITSNEMIMGGPYTTQILRAILNDQTNAYGFVINAENIGPNTYQSLKSAGNGRIQYIKGDISSLNFSSDSIYDDIQNLSDAGTLKTD
jgi:hypothetical protein